MKKLALTLCLVFLTLLTFGQKKKNPYPTAEKALVTIFLKNFEKKPVAKADLHFRSDKNPTGFSVRTDKKGIATLLLPKGQIYRISVEDSLDYDKLEIANKPYLGVRHTIYYHGSINGKAQPLSGAPVFAMMPPKDGLAKISLIFINRQEKPLPNEPIRITGLTSEKVSLATTDEQGKVEFTVPTGEIYQIGVKYNADFDRLNIPRHGQGAARVRVKYGYVGSALIEAKARQREIADSTYKALDEIDDDGHHIAFRSVETEAITPELKKIETDYGFDLQLPRKTTLMTPFYMEDRLYLGGGFGLGELYCIDPKNGETCWGLSLAESGPSLIEGEDGTLVLITESCTIYAVDAIAGTVKWNKWLTPYMRSSPVVADGRVYVAYEDRRGGNVAQPNDPFSHSLACFDLETGDICWQQWLHEDIITAPVVSDGKLFCTTFDGKLLRLNAQTGNIEQELPIYATSSPTVVRSKIFLSYKLSAGGHTNDKEAIGVIDAGSFALLKSFGETHADYLNADKQAQSAYSRLARQRDLGNGVLETALTPQGRANAEKLIGNSGSFARFAHQGSKVIHSENMLYSVRGDELYALEASSGAIKWHHKLPGEPDKAGGFLAGPPAIAGNFLISANQDGSIWILNKSNGKKVATYRTNDGFRNQPVVMNGQIFAPGESGTLCVINTNNKEITGWNGWGN